MSKGLFLLLVLVSALVPAHPLRGATLHVNCYSDLPLNGGDGTTAATSGPNRAKNSIFAAISASSGDAVISVADGVYDESGLVLGSTLADRSVVIQGTSQAGTIITTSDNSDLGVVLPTASALRSTVLFSTLTIDLGNAGSSCVFLSNVNSDMDLRFQDVSFKANAAGSRRGITLQPSGGTGCLQFSNCSFAELGGTGLGIYVKNLQRLVVSGCDFGTAGGVPVYLLENIGFANISGNKCARTQQTFVQVAEGKPGGVVILRQNTVFGRQLLRQLCGTGDDRTNYRLRVLENTFVRFGNSTGVQIGRDKPWSCHDHPGRTIIRGNTLSEDPSAAPAHMILIGGGVDAAVLEANAISVLKTGVNEYGIVLKGLRPTIRNNGIVGIRPLYFVSTVRGIVEYNTLYGLPSTETSYALKWWSQTILEPNGAVQPGCSPATVKLAATASSESGYYIGGILTMTSGAQNGESRRITGYDGANHLATLESALSGAPVAGDTYSIESSIDTNTEGNLIRNNIIVADGSGMVCLHDGGEGPDGVTLNHNIYHTVNRAAVASISGSIFPSLADLRSAWTTTYANSISEENDRDSEQCDPLLESLNIADHGFLHIPWMSPARGAASVEFSDLGAYQRREMPPSDQTATGDLDGDGDVDQSDFGLLQQCLSGPDMPADPDCAN